MKLISYDRFRLSPHIQGVSLISNTQYKVKKSKGGGKRNKLRSLTEPHSNLLHVIAASDSFTLDVVLSENIFQLMKMSCWLLPLGGGFAMWVALTDKAIIGLYVLPTEMFLIIHTNKRQARSPKCTLSSTVDKYVFLGTCYFLQHCALDQLWVCGHAGGMR